MGKRKIGVMIPEPIITNCPKCGRQHIDRGVWAESRLHKTHLCEYCGGLWKPKDVFTVGVEKFPDGSQDHGSVTS